jgi:hypothetical protein
MNDGTFWLTFTNISLGAVTVACAVLLVRISLHGVLHREHKRAPGVTTGDGGGRMDKEYSSEQTGEAGR